MDHLVVMQRALVARHLHLLDEVAVPLLHVLPQSALVAVGRAAPVLAHVRPALFVHRLDVDLQLPLVGKSLWKRDQKFRSRECDKRIFSGSEIGNVPPECVLQF